MNHFSPGWLPVWVAIDVKPALLDETIVQWLEFGSTPLAGPFLEQTVKDLKAQSLAPRELWTNGDSLCRVGDLYSQARPAGFIFHVSHCGSTRVSNSMRVAPGAQVVSESRPAGALLRNVAPVMPWLESRREQRLHKMLQGLFALYSAHPDGILKSLILEFPSIDTMSLPFVRRWWPDVPCLFIVRDPVEVMVSVISASKGWIKLKDDPTVANEIFEWRGISADRMTQEEYCARVLGSYMEKAATCVSGPFEIVDYEDLNPARIRRIGAFFGLKMPEAETSIAEIAGTYSKHPRKSQRFEDDRARKQAAATPEMKAAARQWAMPFYNCIRSI